VSNREIFDWTTWSDQGSALELFGQMTRFGVTDEKYIDKTLFKAVALTDTFQLSAAQTMAIDGGSTGGGDGANARTAFRARIIGDNSPHSFIPDPCDPAYSGNIDYVYKLITMHTMFISTSTTQNIPVTRGDIVLVRLKRSSQTYSLEYGMFEELIAVEDPSGTVGEHCSSLIDLFGEIVHEPFPAYTGGGGATWTGGPGSYAITGDAGAMTEGKKCGSIMTPPFFRFSKSLSALDPRIRGRFQKFFAAAEGAGLKVRITSVRRSPKHQWVLYKYPKCFGAMTPCIPCNSKHQYGFAVDVVFKQANGSICKEGNGCVQRILRPIIKANNLEIKNVGDADYVHWEGKSAADIAAYKELKVKCKAHYYDNNPATAGVAVRNWPLNFKDNIEVIGVTGAAAAIAAGTPEDKKCPEGQTWLEAGESDTETWDDGCYASDGAVEVASNEGGEELEPEAEG
tara:strand:+ start:2494 stop:3858 length:1365 start_codon:yes stop_codon:yes gene_type:complete